MRALTEPQSGSKWVPVPHASLDHPKQRHMCGERFLYLQSINYKHKKETEKLREKAPKEHQIRIRTRLGPQCWEKLKQRDFLHLRAEWKRARRSRQGHQPAGIPVPSEKQDSGSTMKEKRKRTLDSITIFSSYGNNLLWHFIFSWTLASKRIKTGKALIPWSFILLLRYCFYRR